MDKLGNHHPTSPFSIYLPPSFRMLMHRHCHQTADIFKPILAIIPIYSQSAGSAFYFFFLLKSLTRGASGGRRLNERPLQITAFFVPTIKRHLHPKAGGVTQWPIPGRGPADNQRTGRSDSGRALAKLPTKYGCRLLSSVMANRWL